jgi:hypothetical protein
MTIRGRVRTERTRAASEGGFRIVDTARMSLSKRTRYEACSTPSTPSADSLVDRRGRTGVGGCRQIGGVCAQPASAATRSRTRSEHVDHLNLSLYPLPYGSHDLVRAAHLAAEVWISRPTPWSTPDVPQDIPHERGSSELGMVLTSSVGSPSVGGEHDPQSIVIKVFEAVG